MFECYDSTIALRSNGNQALYLLVRGSHLGEDDGVVRHFLGPKNNKCLAHTPRQICPQLKASVVSEKFYGLPAKCYGPQTSIKLGIKNNSFMA